MHDAVAVIWTILSSGMTGVGGLFHSRSFVELGDRYLDAVPKIGRAFA